MMADARFLRYLARIGADGTFVTSVTVEGEARFGVSRLTDGRRKRVLAAALDQAFSERPR